MQVQSLHHITLTLSDFERSRKFYGELLGFEVTDVTYNDDTV